jgi:hypothetical protein
MWNNPRIIVEFLDYRRHSKKYRIRKQKEGRIRLDYSQPLFTYLFKFKLKLWLALKVSREADVNRVLMIVQSIQFSDFRL